MPRILTNIEVNAFLDRHPDAVDQIDRMNLGQPAMPSSGRAWKDPSGRYVLVWRDARKRWWFIDLADMTNFALEVNKPLFVSPDASLLQNILDALAAAGQPIVTSLKWVPIIVGVALAIALYRQVA